MSVKGIAVAAARRSVAIARKGAESRALGQRLRQELVTPMQVEKMLLTSEMREWMAARTLRVAKRTAPRRTGAYHSQWGIERHSGSPTVVNRIAHRGEYASAVRIEGTGRTHYQLHVWPAALRAKRLAARRAIQWLVHEPKQAKELKKLLLPRKRKGRKRRVR